MSKQFKLVNAECIETMKRLPDNSIDLILTDPPYGTTACKWDSIIPLDKMWEQLKRIIKPNGAIVLFGSEPFSSFLRCSNIKNFKYDWIWDKTKGSNFQTVKYQPFKTHEIISVFSKKTHSYNPIMTESPNDNRIRGKEYLSKNTVYGEMKGKACPDYNNKVKYPKSIQSFKRNWSPQQSLHPTQKPVALMEYLIKTYTNEGETVLDFTMGSGTTGVACKNTGRSFIGIERDEGYFKIAQDRITKELNLFQK